MQLLRNIFIRIYNSCKYDKKECKLDLFSSQRIIKGNVSICSCTYNMSNLHNSCLNHTCIFRLGFS